MRQIWKVPLALFILVVAMLLALPAYSAQEVPNTVDMIEVDATVTPSVAQVAIDDLMGQRIESTVTTSAISAAFVGTDRTFMHAQALAFAAEPVLQEAGIGILAFKDESMASAITSTNHEPAGFDLRR